MDAWRDYFVCRKLGGRGRLAALGAAVLWLALALAACPSPSAAESRVALVIGNGGYRSVVQLANPPNDARDVAGALKSLGFRVTLGVDLDQAQMERAIGDFALSAASADVSLFYYGGHGLQVAAHNYLVPVDAEVRSADDIDKRMIHLDSVLDDLAKGRGLHLVFLDACRNNPFKDFNLASGAAGLARVGDAAGFLIAFATQPDNVAYDGGGRNSPFARALLGHVATPGVDVSSMMIGVRRDVIAATGGAQIPWENSSLTRQFYFAGEGTSDSSPKRCCGALPAASATRACCRSISNATPTANTPPTCARCLARSEPRPKRRRPRRAPMSRNCCGAWR